MIDVKVLRTENLRALIDATETDLEELKAELDRRQDDARHQEIEKLEGHFKEAELSLRTIKDFLAEVLKEIRGKSSSAS